MAKTGQIKLPAIPAVPQQQQQQSPPAVALHKQNST